MLNDLLSELQNDITSYIVYGEVMIVWMVSIVILYRYEERKDERDNRRTA